MAPSIAVAVFGLTYNPPTRERPAQENGPSAAPGRATGRSGLGGLRVIIGWRAAPTGRTKLRPVSTLLRRPDRGRGNGPEERAPKGDVEGGARGDLPAIGDAPP